MALGLDPSKTPGTAHSKPEQDLYQSSGRDRDTEENLPPAKSGKEDALSAKAGAASRQKERS